MRNIKKLHIEAHKDDTQPNIRFENLGGFFDVDSKVYIQKMYIESDLKVGFVYDFTYEDYNDEDAYCYVVLKREGNIYYISEYYDRFYQYPEGCLGRGWVRCDVKAELGIDIEEWRTKKIYGAQMPDMRLKVEEYITELDQEIDRCYLQIEDNMSGDACFVSEMEGRVKALTEVKNDLQSRLEGLI